MRRWVRNWRSTTGCTSRSRAMYRRPTTFGHGWPRWRPCCIIRCRLFSGQGCMPLSTTNWLSARTRGPLPVRSCGIIREFAGRRSAREKPWSCPMWSGFRDISPVIRNPAARSSCRFGTGKGVCSPVWMWTATGWMRSTGRMKRGWKRFSPFFLIRRRSCVGGVSYLHHPRNPVRLSAIVV